jgi:hypothetical protein
MLAVVLTALALGGLLGGFPGALTRGLTFRPSPLQPAVYR